MVDILAHILMVSRTDCLNVTILYNILILLCWTLDKCMYINFPSGCFALNDNLINYCSIAINDKETLIWKYVIFVCEMILKQHYA